MRVKVQECWGGNDRFYFRLLIPSYGRYIPGQRFAWGHSTPYVERISGERWNRRTASEALSLLESVYGIPRRVVRFLHV